MYGEVSEYLRRETLKALPSGQRKLMTMILRKLLASSTYAIAGTLETLIFRLENMLKSGSANGEPPALSDDFETADEYQNFDGEEKLLENFDAEVAERLNVYQEASAATVDKMQAVLWALTRHELADTGTIFDDENLTLQLLNPTVFTHIKHRFLGIKRASKNCEQYGINHELAEELVARAKSRKLPYCGILFDYGNFSGKITAIEKLPRKSGKLMLSKVFVGDEEEHLVLTCVDDSGRTVEPETARRFFNLNAKTYQVSGEFEPEKIDEIFAAQKAEIARASSAKAEKEFDAEVEKLENWSADRKAALEAKLREMDKRIKDLKRAARAPHTLEEKIELQRAQKTLDNERMAMRQKLFEAQDAIDAERDKLIEKAEKNLQNPITSQIIFTIDWRIV